MALNLSLVSSLLPTGLTMRRSDGSSTGRGLGLERRGFYVERNQSKHK